MRITYSYFKLIIVWSLVHWYIVLDVYWMLWLELGSREQGVWRRCEVFEVSEVDQQQWGLGASAADV